MAEPTNALAPAPVNALATAPQNRAAQLPAQWGKFLTPNSAAYEAAVLLNSTGQLPKINFANFSEPGRSGEYDRKLNAITLAANRENLARTLPHELTHALRGVMEDKVRGISEAAKQTKTPLAGFDKQLVDAWYKLDPDFSKLPSLQYPDADYQNYRFSFGEAPAFAVGNMEDPRKSLSRAEYYSTSPGGGHYDATMATEQAILRDLYARQANVKLRP
ncbi:MAG: hypothetical protein WCO62_13750 [Betaproteobacteria bacterium]